MGKYRTFYYYTETQGVIDAMAIGEIYNNRLNGYGHYLSSRSNIVELGNFINGDLSGYGCHCNLNEGSILIANWGPDGPKKGLIFEQSNEHGCISFRIVDSNRQDKIAIIFWSDGNFKVFCGPRQIQYDAVNNILYQYQEIKGQQPYLRTIRLLEAFDFDMKFEWDPFTYDMDVVFDDQYFTQYTDSVFTTRSFGPGISEKDDGTLFISNFYASNHVSDGLTFVKENNGTIFVAEYNMGEANGQILQIEEDYVKYYKAAEGNDFILDLTNNSIAINYEIPGSKNFNVLMFKPNGDVSVILDHNYDTKKHYMWLDFKFGE